MAIAIKNQAGSDVDFVKESFRFEDAVTQRGTLSFQEIGTSPSCAWGEDVFVFDDGGNPLFYAGDLPIELESGGFLELAATTTYWGGTVESVSEDDITVGDTTTVRFTYRCIDFSEFAGRLIITDQTVNETAGAWVQSLLSGPLGLSYYYGVTAGNIDDGAYIDYMPWNYVSIELALDELAEISGFFWNIDKDKKLNFQSVDAAAAPFSITTSNKPYKSIRFSTVRGSYRNQVFVRAGTANDDDNTVEVQLGDGNKRAFVVGAEIGDTPTIEVDTGSGYATKTVGVNGIGTVSDFYYNTGSSVVVQDPGQTVLSATDKIKITYKARYPIIVSASNDAEIVDRTAAESGAYALYQSVVDATDVDNAEAAELKAQSILNQYSQPRITCRYTTDQVNIEAGQTQYIDLTEHGIDANFLIEKIGASLRHDGQLSFDVTAAATQTVAGWSYWKQKTRQDRKFVVRDNEVLRLLNSEKDNATAADTATGTTYTGAYTVNGTDTYIDGFHVG
jgi:hypothetical protein